MAPHQFKEDDRVQYESRSKGWIPCSITKCNSDGTYDTTVKRGVKLSQLCPNSESEAAVESKRAVDNDQASAVPVVLKRNRKGDDDQRELLVRSEKVKLKKRAEVDEVITVKETVSQEAGGRKADADRSVPMDGGQQRQRLEKTVREPLAADEPGAEPAMEKRRRRKERKSQADEDGAAVAAASKPPGRAPLPQPAEPGAKRRRKSEQADVTDIRVAQPLDNVAASGPVESVSKRRNYKAEKVGFAEDRVAAKPRGKSASPPPMRKRSPTPERRKETSTTLAHHELFMPPVQLSKRGASASPVAQRSRSRDRPAARGQPSEADRRSSPHRGQPGARGQPSEADRRLSPPRGQRLQKVDISDSDKEDVMKAVIRREEKKAVEKRSSSSEVPPKRKQVRSPSRNLEKKRVPSRERVPSRDRKRKRNGSSSPSFRRRRPVSPKGKRPVSPKGKRSRSKRSRRRRSEDRAKERRDKDRDRDRRRSPPRRDREKDRDRRGGDRRRSPSRRRSPPRRPRDRSMSRRPRGGSPLRKGGFASRFAGGKGKEKGKGKSDGKDGKGGGYLGYRGKGGPIAPGLLGGPPPAFAIPTPKAAGGAPQMPMMSRPLLGQLLNKPAGPVEKTQYGGKPTAGQYTAAPGSFVKTMPQMFDAENGLWENSRSVTGLQLLGELAPAYQWNYVLNDDKRRSYAAYLKSPFSPDQCSQFFTTVEQGTNWGQPAGKHGPIPRKTAWMVSSGCQCMYSYGTTTVAPQEFPPWMLDLMGVTMPICGIPEPKDWPNSCNLNLYEGGGMAVGWHSDDEAIFQGKFQDIRILSLTFGVTRKFELRANFLNPDEKAIKTLSLGNGDLCTMEGMMQKHFQHRVPKEKGVHGPRINLTWRWNVKHTPKCPATRRRF